MEKRLLWSNGYPTSNRPYILTGAAFPRLTKGRGLDAVKFVIFVKKNLENTTIRSALPPTIQIAGFRAVKFMIPEQRAFIIKGIRSWGGPVSDAILNSGCQIFTCKEVEGFVGYYLTTSCAIVMGDPLCNGEKRALLASTFHEFCRAKKLTTIYVAVSKNFADWALQHVCQASIEFGEELSVDPHVDLQKERGSHAVLRRKKIKHAVLEGTIVEEYIPSQADLEQKMDEVGVAWLKERRGAQIYLSPIKLFAEPEGKRWFYAQRGGEIVGVAALHPREGRQGWLLNHLITTKKASHGTSELLISSVLQKFAKENCPYVAFGIVPGSSLGEIKGMGKGSAWLSRLGFMCAQRVFHLEGRKKFWEKFDPYCEPSYLLFSEPSIKVREVIALLRALHA